MNLFLLEYQVQLNKQHLLKKIRDYQKNIMSEPIYVAYGTGKEIPNAKIVKTAYLFCKGRKNIEFIQVPQLTTTTNLFGKGLKKQQ